MNLQMNTAVRISVVLSIVLALALAAVAQEPSPTDGIYGVDHKDMKVAMGNNLYCGGYISKTGVDTNVEIVGADDEKDQFIYAQGDDMYINAGSGSGVKVGDMYSVIRPKGRFHTKFSSKGDLGIYIQEIGAVEVIAVMSEVSVARVKKSCGAMLLGDLLKGVEKRESPIFTKRPALQKFAASSGKASGRIVMARDGVEMVGREMIVYVDLGREDNVQIGDYMTIYRPLGTGNIYKYVQPEHMDAKEAGYESDRYRGGRFSNQTARKKGSEAKGGVVTTEDAKSGRPKGIRKVVGELIVLNVMERTATAMIVRNASEIHTGDMVEVQ